MNPVFNLGIDSLWDELRQLQSGGLCWLNTDRGQDAARLANQTLAAQQPDASVIAITMAADPRAVFTTIPTGPEAVRLYNIPASQPAIDALPADLLTAINPQDCFVILLCAENFWRNISASALQSWVTKMDRWAKSFRCTFLVLNPDLNADQQVSLLMPHYQSLSGLATLRYQGDCWLYDVAFWFNPKGVSAQQTLKLALEDGRWRLEASQQAAPQSGQDERRILSHIAVLEGAPPLSDNWQLFDDNEALFTAARQAQAATIVFSLARNNQIEPLARAIHALRRQRGTMLKILVRESMASIRATDERLLTGCGANLIIPWNAPLSRCLSLIEGVQGQVFSRPVPPDISQLLEAVQPLKLRGWQPWDNFCDAIAALLTNPLVPKDSRGVLVALRPVPGIRVEQALTLCRLHRTGDIVTLGDNRIVLFLSFCRINDLDKALSHIFPLPIRDIFSNRMVWFEDNQIGAELVQMRAIPPAQRSKPLKITRSADRPEAAAQPERLARRQPVPLTLLADPARELRE